MPARGETVHGIILADDVEMRICTTASIQPHPIPSHPIPPTPSVVSSAPSPPTPRKVVINALEHIPDMRLLLLGRVLGGISTSLLFSAFESWMVSQHRKQGEEQLGLP